MANLQDIIAAIERQRSNDPIVLQQLQEINDKLGNIQSRGSGQGMSQGRARDFESEQQFGNRRTSSAQSDFNERMERHRPNRNSRSGSSGMGLNSVLDEFTDGIEEQLMEGLTGSSFSSMISQSLNEFANALGADLSDLPKGLGQFVGRQLSDAFKRSPIGQDISNALTNVKTQFADRINSALGQATGRILNRQEQPSSEQINPEVNVSDIQSMGQNVVADREGLSEIASNSNAIQQLGTELSQQAGQQAAQQAGQKVAQEALTKSIGKLGVYGLILIAVLKVIDVSLSKAQAAINEAKQAIDASKQAVQTASNRYYESAKFSLKENRKRIEADYNALIEAPFKILKESAESVQKAWNETMTTITATQGYSKAELQDLMAVYANRIRSAGLESVVSAADMTTNLAKVLESGLSGKVAEEFAYLASILNRAIPTEDFFNYSSVYATIAANALKSGQSQADAIEYANEQLTSFANNLLYASRDVAGGFSTGLKDASSLLTSAVKIANTAKAGDASTISGVLTSASAIIGAIAPDLASSLIDNIVSAATGGNAASIASLRSLAGVGASNTDFIRALATDPQSVFANMFDRLASLQKMSNDNFMEVAEGLSDVFGVSMDAFARVDFNYLASSIRNMDVDSKALNENMERLIQGDTTSTAEQLRMQQINSYILEEGLAYVLDNEVAQLVQEHMWQQEQTKALQEATYGVNIIGSTAETILSIYNVIKTIVTILNPLSWGIAVGDAISAVVDTAALERDIDAAIKAGVVGVGTSAEYARLTNRNLLTNSNSSWRDALTSGYVSAVTGRNSSYATSQELSKLRHSLSSIFFNFGMASDPALIGNTMSSLIDSVFGRSELSVAPSASSEPESRYKGLVGKSAINSLRVSANSSNQYRNLNEVDYSAQDAILRSMGQKFSTFASTMNDYISKEGGSASYESWLATARESGIADVKSAMSDLSISDTQLRDAFMQAQAAAGTELLKQNEAAAQDFYTKGSRFLGNNSEFQSFESSLDARLLEMETLQHEDITSLHRTINQDLIGEQLSRRLVPTSDYIKSQLDNYIQAWTDYYINHTYYTQRSIDVKNVADIVNAEKGETGDAVLALANSLTSNSISDLTDPVVQQNVLLAQILKVLEAIMQQNNEAATVSLPTTLSSLGLGITNTTY